MNYISDTKAGKAISAYLIFDKRGELVGKIQAHYSDGGTCWVQLWDWTNDERFQIQNGKATGYGYDKFTAAISGMTFAGFTLADHCDTNDTTKRAMAAYTKLADQTGEGWKQPEFFARWKARGVDFANYSTESQRYGSAYLIPGLKGIEARGFKVLQAI